MARYIDAENLLNECDEAISNIQFNSPYQDEIDVIVRGMELIRDMLEVAPTADVVEVVRCKDCKYFMEYTDEYKVENADGDCYLRVVNSTNPQFNAVKYDEFCSYGKRYST